MKKITERLDYYILKAVKEKETEDVHCVEAKDIRKHNPEKLRIGSLYATLARMGNDDLIIKKQHICDKGLLHPCYSLSDFGRNYLEGVEIIAKNNTLNESQN